jgi:hypothetical protein
VHFASFVINEQDRRSPPRSDKALYAAKLARKVDAEFSPIDSAIRELREVTAMAKVS